MNIKAMATKLNIPAKKLLSEFSKKFPEQSWTLDSEVPEGFEEAASTHAQEYAEASGVELPRGELTSIPDAVRDNRLILESIEYGVVEAIAQLRTTSLIQASQLRAVRDIQESESAYSNVWESYFSKKAASTEAQTQAIAQQELQRITQLNSELGKRQGELIRTQENHRNSQAQAQARTQATLDALLK